MLGGNSSNSLFPVFLDENQFQYPPNASNQLQLFESIPVGCSGDPANFFGREHNNMMFRPNKRGREAEPISRQQNLQKSVDHETFHDEPDQAASLRIQNPVSTGLRLSYDDDEHNSSISSASGSMTAAPPLILSLGDNLERELDRQKEEFDRYIKFQEEYLMKGVKGIKQRHMASFLKTIEKTTRRKLQEKDNEIENINRKNMELVERIKQVASEAQNWHTRAKYNESVVNVLKTNLKQAQSQGTEQLKEGFGDSDIDDTASAPTNFLNSMPRDSQKFSLANGRSINCRVCKVKEVSFLLMPCRHLCLCKDCEELVNVCPVCQLVKTAGVRVYTS